MRRTVPLALVTTLAVMSRIAMAQAPASEQEHAAHHPPGASAPAAKAKQSARTAPPATTMKSMQDMHAKMMAAKTAEERQALMSEHMKAMQDGMAMMNQMKGDKGAMSPDAMAKRMDMMEMMLQMMMDREAARTPVNR